MGVLEILILMIFVQFLKDKLEIFDSLFIHLEIFIDSDDILDEPHKVQLL